jgi:hypothetical protein
MEGLHREVDSCVMDTATETTRPYLRNAAVCLVPQVTDEQVGRIHAELRHLSPFVLLRRLTKNTVLVEGIPVFASSPHDAELTAWETVAAFVRMALGEARDTATRITSIDIHDREEALLWTRSL